MARVRLAALICSAALVVGLAIGLIANSAGGTTSDPPKAAGTRLQRLAATAVGAVDVPALKLPKSAPRVTTPAVPPSPVVVTPPAVPPPSVVTPPPPPPPPPPAGPDITRR
jgi:hypothetical protein